MAGHQQRLPRFRHPQTTRTHLTQRLASRSIPKMRVSVPDSPTLHWQSAFGAEYKFELAKDSAFNEAHFL